MTSLLSRLNGTKTSVPIEPRDIFMSLPQKDKRYEYPRDVQSDVWKHWFQSRNKKNCVIKMNTGSGKTVVGLMILQSCLNEGKGPAVYVVPDNYLVSQVCNEAKKLGLSVTTNKDDYSYTEKKAILVITIHSLVNGHSVFGMRTYNNYPIGSILLDDVHTCLDIISNQFSIRIPSSHVLYSEMVNLFADRWKNYNINSYNEIVGDKLPDKMSVIPFWMWQESQTEICSLLSKYNNDEKSSQSIFFSFPLLKDSLNTCDCFVSSRCIEIVPEGIAISKISSFVNAERRIFMSATLSDDSVFVSAMGLQKEDISDIISPESANDIGDRLILFPKHLNSRITDDEIKDKVQSVSENYNVVVVVPSRERAKYWDPDNRRTITKDNIAGAVDGLKKDRNGLLIFVNRYDGIDLPDDACRMLVIDGLPPLKNEKEKYVHSIDPASAILRRERIQKIEQGMGRGVRSNSDSCCVVLMGDDLADVLLRNDGTRFFSNATKEQYELSKELWGLLKNQIAEPSIDDIFELADYSLNRVVEWIKKSKERLSTVVYSREPQFDDNTLTLRCAYDYSMKLRWDKAIGMLDQAINSELQDSTKGYLLQIKAKLTNFIDKKKAQEVLLSGRALNTRILAPVDGVRFDKTIRNMHQAKSICKYISDNCLSPNDYVIYFDEIASSLVFASNADQFENALQSIGKLIGFGSTRPDKETSGRGPDNLWDMCDGNCLVIECKNKAVTDTISKDYCNQLAGSIRWFSERYRLGKTAIPVLVHRSTIIDEKASVVDNMKIFTPENLECFKNKVRDFTVAITQDENWLDEGKIHALLDRYNLCGTDIVKHYMSSFKNAL